VKGDFSRITFDPAKHYSRVLQQQGRVQLDADSNEQADIVAYRDRTLARDLIGANGAPEDGGGFAVCSVDGPDLRISPGRLYVEGRLCELCEATTYLRQPYLPRPTALSPVEGRDDLVYLDVWERHITGVEDPELRDPALGGPDTATRVRTVWQIRVVAGVEVAECDDPIDGWPPPASDGRVAATTRGRVENQLYRVEIHDSGGVGAATFKWSRDNGSVVWEVRELVDAAGSGSGAVVEGFGRARGLLPEPGDWVEVAGDQSELMLAPGTIARVERVNAARATVWLDRDASSHVDESHLKLRRWDQRGQAQTVSTGNSWIDLDDGVRVQFSNGRYRTGDYWTFPAREAHDADWPPVGPRGMHHDYCILAVIRWTKDANGGWSAAVRDCRPRFRSLSRRPAESCERCREEIAQLRTMLEHQAHALRELRARLP
jgi:hypothetical protein